MTKITEKDAAQVLALMKRGRRDEANIILGRFGLELKPGHSLPTKKGT